MRVRMVATKSMRYATRALKAGEFFEAPNRDARILEGLGKARRATLAAAPMAPIDANFSADVAVSESPPKRAVRRSDIYRMTKQALADFLVENNVGFPAEATREELIDLALPVRP